MYAAEHIFLWQEEISPVVILKDFRLDRHPSVLREVFVSCFNLYGQMLDISSSSFLVFMVSSRFSTSSPDRPRFVIASVVS
jgi:hypothetical protein